MVGHNRNQGEIERNIQTWAPVDEEGGGGLNSVSTFLCPLVRVTVQVDHGYFSVLEY